MRLQSDPTVIYGNIQKYGYRKARLTRKDLRKDNLWNTYTRKGLPYTPICNPGVDAIEAVLHPISSKELYFVAHGDGTHMFANNLWQHNINVKKWKKIRKEKYNY